MFVEVGHFAAILALAFAFVGTASAFAGGPRNPAWVRAGSRAVWAVCVLLTLSIASLVYAFLTNDFSVKYVAANSNRILPVFYKIAAVWGGHEGSLLFWVWLMSVFAAAAVTRHWSTHPVSMPYLIGVQSAVMTGFLVLVLFLSSPFERLVPAPADGVDLNPLLQDPGMVLHPPFLYLGYVGFSVPFAFAMAALFSGRAGDEWVLATRRWTILAWFFLSVGIFFGARWAYYELGWGGYWAWDPVENASLMPWLTGTAFLHSTMIQEKRNLFRVWNVALVILTFALSILGTFLVRSGIVSSVHAFANDPGRGLTILVLLAVLLIVSFGTLIVRADRLRADVSLDSVVSRESAFLFNNVFFLTATFTVLVGTLFPLAAEALAGTKVSVGAPYYNKVFVPLMLGMLVLMGVGPLIAWRQAGISNLKRNFAAPALGGLAAGAVAAAVGMREIYPLIAVVVVVFVLGTIGIDAYKSAGSRARRDGLSLAGGLARIVRRNKRRYGGMVIHVGVLLMVLGMAGSGNYQAEKSLVMKPGDSFEIAGYAVAFKEIRESRGPNWMAIEGVFEARNKGALIAELKPQRRVYSRSSMPMTEAAIHSTLTHDLYVVIGDEVPGQGIAVKAYVNPLIQWIWAGGGVMALGTVIVMFQRRRTRLKGAAS